MPSPTTNTLPWITFTLNGATITVQETPTATASIAVQPSTTQPSTSSSISYQSSIQSTKSSSVITETIASSLKSSTASITLPPLPKESVPASCAQAVTTLSNLEQARAFVTACSEWKGDIVIASNVSSPIDLSGLHIINGSLMVDGSDNTAFDTLSSDTLSQIEVNLSISNTESLSNISFPKMQLLRGLNIINNVGLHEFDSMMILGDVFGPINMNGSFTSVSFRSLDHVENTFDIDSSDDIDCAAVAPMYSGDGGAVFSCISPNNSLTVSGNGTVITQNVPGPRGFDVKDEIIVGTVVGVVVLMAFAGLYYWWLKRKAMAHVVTMARAPRQNHRGSTVLSMQNTPVSMQGFQTHRPSPNLAAIDPHLLRQLDELNERATRPGGLNPHQTDRRNWILEEIRGAERRNLQQPGQC